MEARKYYTRMFVCGLGREEPKVHAFYLTYFVTEISLSFCFKTE